MASVEIQVLQGALKGNSLLFTAPECVLFGRAADATLQVADDPFVSRHHFLLEVAPPFVLLTDLGSKNGVFINDIRYGGREPTVQLGGGRGPAPPRSAFLVDGDQIIVGQNRLVVNISEGEGKAITPRKRVSTKRAFPFSGVPTASMGEIAPESMVGPYQVQEEIGRGWMGAVYRAVDTRSGAVVSVKTMVPNVLFQEEAAEPFLHWGRELFELDHVAVCRLTDLWRSGTMFAAVQEFVEGHDLANLLVLRTGRLDMEEAAPIMLDVLAGLAHAEAHPLSRPFPGFPGGTRSGLLHRDLKPTNILVFGRGRYIQAKVSDVGLFRALEAAGLTQMILSGLYADAPNYWPRERITWFGRVFPASEVFSAAAVFYEMLTGFLPREGLHEVRRETNRSGRIPGLADYLGVIAESKPVPILERHAKIPEAVAVVLDRALAEPVVNRSREDPEAVLSHARFPDLAAFRGALLAALQAHGLAPHGDGIEPLEGLENAAEKIDAALLVVDLAGSTQLVNKQGTVVFSNIVNSFNSLFRTHESRTGLRFLKCTGDGFFAIYRQADEALEAARAVVAEAAIQQIQVRVAMNWGCITIASDGDFLGREVHKLFRIEGLKDADRVSADKVPFPAHGRILVTRVFAERTKGGFVNLGMFRLKGFEEPCEIFLFREPDAP